MVSQKNIKQYCDKISCMLKQVHTTMKVCTSIEVELQSLTKAIYYFGKTEL